MGRTPINTGSCPSFCNSVILRKTGVLFGVQFDDVGFVDFVFVRKFISLRESGQSSCPVVEALFDVWKIEGLQFLEGLLEHFVSSVSFAEEITWPARTG